MASSSPRGGGKLPRISPLHNVKRHRQPLLLPRLVVTYLTFLLLVLPWLNPRAGGPSASVEPWLIAAVCAAAAALTAPDRRVRASMAWGFAALGIWAALRTGLTLDTAALAAALTVIVIAARSSGAWAGAREQGAIVAYGWLAAAIASTLIAFFQYFGWADLLGSIASPSSQFEAYANLRQRNQFASLSAIGLAALTWHVTRRGLGAAAAFGAVALAAADAATMSRTGLLELVVLVLLAALWPGQGRRARVHFAIVTVLSFASASFALPWLQAQAGVADPTSLWSRVSGVAACSSRTVLWSNVLHLIAQKPWFGWGWGELDYAHYATLYNGPRFCDIADNAHNLPLHLAVELGVPVALLVCGFVLWAVLRAKPWRETDPTRQLAWSVLAILALHSMLEYPLWYGPFQIALGLAIGLLWPGKPLETPRARWVQAILPALLLAAVAYAAWDYHRVSQIYLAPEDRAAAYREDTLEQVRRSRLFHSQAAFAELTITPLTRENAQWTHDLALELLHYSPEPKIIEKVIESATMLGREDEALWHLARFRAAFPEAYREWARQLREGRPQGDT